MDIEPIESKQFWNPEGKGYDILWDSMDMMPAVQLKHGVSRRVYPLTKQFVAGRDKMYFVNEQIELKGQWDNTPEFGSMLNLKLKNISKKSISIARLIFPAENGLDYFLKSFNPSNIAFLRNGYQSWSTTRSYRLKDKPLRPWLSLVSLTSSNMANLPSNTPGNLSSEMYSVITNLQTDESFLVGQATNFNQFIYIKMYLKRRESKKSYLEIVYDFGRKVLLPGETINLDSILFAKGETVNLQRKYFNFIKRKNKINIPEENFRGWCSWYYYFNKITPEIIIKNVKQIKEKQLDFNLIQIDDGYQRHVGDWLDLMPKFSGRMAELAGKIKENGYIPGIWIAPFIADKSSNLVKDYPEFILRTEYGKPITAGYNPVWPGKFYYSLDITNIKVEEYIKDVIKTMVHKWGFKYLKLDFLFGACMRGGNHHNMRLTRAEIIKKGLKIIREAAGKDVTLAGCGMPISPGIGILDTMRVSPDTAPFWQKFIVSSILQTGAMLGVKNAIRNTMVRSFMHKNLWLNDPDCIMMRDVNTKLTPSERETVINFTILTGGVFMLSDDMELLNDKTISKIGEIIKLNDQCSKFESIPVDIMENEIPSIYFNTSGMLGIFNYKSRTVNFELDLFKYNFVIRNIKRLRNVWTDEVINITAENSIVIPGIKPHGSKLFYME